MATVVLESSPLAFNLSKSHSGWDCETSTVKQKES
jgi:hypothetical protein